LGEDGDAEHQQLGTKVLALDRLVATTLPMFDNALVGFIHIK